MGGRPPKSKAQHIKDGTYQKCRHETRGTKLELVTCGIDCPSSIQGTAREVWSAVIPELSKAGLITLVDAPQLEHAFKCYQYAMQCRETIEKKGGIIKYLAGLEFREKNLADEELKYMQEWERILWKYGMTPVEASKIKNNIKKEEDDDELIKSIMGQG